MVDYHVHVGEGYLLPSEAMRYGRRAGYKALGLLVRADSATLPLLLPWLLQMVRHYSLYAEVEAFAGVELVHVPPQLMPEAVAEARTLGAALVVGHGESLGDVVERGSNLAAIQAGVDILAHPGLLTPEDAYMAAERGVILELSTAPRHSLCNARVAALAQQTGCGLVLNGDVKRQEDFASPDLRQGTLLGAGLTEEGMELVQDTTAVLLQRLLKL